jgi:serine/threonine protein kinase
MVKKTRKLKGGKYVYHGAYGCTYKPAMKCQGDKDRIPNAISKIMNKEEAKEEFQKRFFLKPVDPEQQFFLWPKRMCSVRPRDLTVENDLDSCPLVDDEFQKSLKDAALLIYGDGGSDLFHIKLDFTQYREFFKGMGQLFEGLALLHSKNVVHLDIKPTNIVAKQNSNGTFKFYYIDFGFATPIQHYDTAGVPNVDYKYWPYEYRFVMKSFGPSKITASSVQQWKDNIYTWPELKGLEYLTINTEQINYNTFLNFGENREKRMVPLLKAVDVFSLAVTLLDVYNQRIGHRLEFDYSDGRYNVDISDKIKSSNSRTKALHFLIMLEVSGPFLGLLAKMINLELTDRITAQQALEEFRRIVSKFDMLEPSLVSQAFRDLEVPPTPPPPPAPESPGLRDIQTSLFVSTPIREPTELSGIRPNVFIGGRRKTHRKRR